MPETITAEQLRQVRAEWGMTQKEFSELLGAVYGTYRGWEDDRFAVPTSVARHVETIGKMRRLYESWDAVPRAIMQIATSPDPIDALNEADARADEHESLWGELFPQLKRDDPQFKPGE